jgi:hypothetical protein
LKVDIALSLDPDFAAVALDSEARNGVQRGSTLGLAGAQAESRVVPRAPNGFAHDQPFRQRTAVMRADGAGGKYILALPHQHDCFIVNVAQKRHVFRQTSGIHA